MTRKVPEYHGRDRTDCDCGVCTGEDAYLDSIQKLSTEILKERIKKQQAIEDELAQRYNP